MTVQRSLGLQPREKSVGLPLLDQQRRDLLIACAIDSERQSDSVLIERAWQKLKMTDEENSGCQSDMNRYGE
jgi:hypothetical protein